MCIKQRSTSVRLRRSVIKAPMRNAKAAMRIKERGRVFKRSVYAQNQSDYAQYRALGVDCFSVII